MTNSAKVAKTKSAKVAETKSGKLAETKSAKVVETKTVKVAELKSGKVAETKSGKVVETKSAKVAETKSTKVAKTNSIKVAETTSSTTHTNLATSETTYATSISPMIKIALNETKLLMPEKQSAIVETKSDNVAETESTKTQTKYATSNTTSATFKTKSSIAETKAVDFITKVLRKTKLLSVQNLIEYFENASQEIREACGQSRASLLKFIKTHKEVFQITSSGDVSLLVETSNTVPVCASSKGDYANAAVKLNGACMSPKSKSLQNVNATVIKVFSAYGILSWNGYGEIYFTKQMCSFNSKTLSFFHQLCNGDRVIVDADRGPKNSACYWRATEVHFPVNDSKARSEMNVKNKVEESPDIQWSDTNVHENKLEELIKFELKVHGPITLEKLHTFQETNVSLQNVCGRYMSGLLSFLKRHATEFSVRNATVHAQMNTDKVTEATIAFNSEVVNHKSTKVNNTLPHQVVPIPHYIMSVKDAVIATCLQSVLLTKEAMTMPSSDINMHTLPPSNRQGYLSNIKKSQILKCAMRHPLLFKSQETIALLQPDVKIMCKGTVQKTLPAKAGFLQDCSSDAIVYFKGKVCTFIFEVSQPSHHYVSVGQELYFTVEPSSAANPFAYWQATKVWRDLESVCQKDWKDILKHIMEIETESSCKQISCTQTGETGTVGRQAETIDKQVEISDKENLETGTCDKEISDRLCAKKQTLLMWILPTSKQKPVIKRLQTKK